MTELLNKDERFIEVGNIKLLNDPYAGIHHLILILQYLKKKDILNLVYSSFFKQVYFQTNNEFSILIKKYIFRIFIDKFVINHDLFKEKDYIDNALICDTSIYRIKCDINTQYLNRRYDIGYELNLKCLFKGLLATLKENYHYLWYRLYSHDFSDISLKDMEYNPNKGLTDEIKKLFYDLKKGLNIKQFYLNTDISKKHFLSIFKISGDITRSFLNHGNCDILYIEDGGEFTHAELRIFIGQNKKQKEKEKKKIIEKLDIDNDQLILIDFRLEYENVSFKFQSFSMRGFDHPSENFSREQIFELSYNKLSEGWDYWKHALFYLDAFRRRELENYSFKPKKIVFFFGNDYDISYFISEGTISYENDDTQLSTPGKTTLRGD